jgi:hypothetical protein
MTELKNIIPKTIILNTKLKMVLFICAMLLSGYGAYQLSDYSNSHSLKNSDPFDQDIHNRADKVYNVVTDAVNQPVNTGPITRKQRYENALSYIQKERLSTNYNYNSLSTENKNVIQKYRVYLKDAAMVVVKSSNGEKVNSKISDMATAKALI